jgi:hypothetical protein
MTEFSFEVINETNINIEYVYGTEKFILNLFLRQGSWTIHPFDGILLYNRELCRNVMIDLFKNKHFQTMLAKENIFLSSLRTSIDLDPSSQPPESINNRGGLDRSGDLQDYIEYNDITDILMQEKHFVEERLGIFKDILHKMFQDNYGPNDKEFNTIQELVRAYNETLARINSLVDVGLGWNDRKRI